jgi:hypothetical protein
LPATGPPAAHVIRIYFVSPDFVAIKDDVLGKTQAGLPWLLNASNPKKAVMNVKTTLPA